MLGCDSDGDSESILCDSTAAIRLFFFVCFSLRNLWRFLFRDSGNRAIRDRNSFPLRFPDLPFLAVLEKARKPTQKSKDFFSTLNPKIPRKEGQNAQKSKEIPCNEKSKDIQKSKERKIRVLTSEFKGGTGRGTAKRTLYGMSWLDTTFCDIMMLGWRLCRNKIALKSFNSEKSSRP